VRVLVTGGCGFIGSHVSAHLHRVGYDVHVLDRLSYAGKIRNVEPLLPHVRVWVGDLKEWDVCVRLAEQHFDAIVHMASNTHVDHSIRNPRVFVLDNTVATDQLLHAIAVHGDGAKQYPRVIVYSTDEVFGPTPPGECFTESAAYSPSNPYSASKVAMEALCRSYAVTFGLQPIVVRPCNTYGPRQHPEKVIPRFVRQAISGQPLTIHNDGSGSRDWLHVDDHARAIATLLHKGVVGESYNLAAGEEHTDLEIAERVIVQVNPDVGVTSVMVRPGHDRRYWMCGDKLRALGWQPHVPFDQGFRDTVAWNVANPRWWDADDVDIAAFRQDAHIPVATGEA